jgi:hypothetical protein
VHGGGLTANVPVIRVSVAVLVVAALSSLGVAGWSRLGSARQRPQAQSRASCGLPTGEPVGRRLGC